MVLHALYRDLHDRGYLGVAKLFAPSEVHDELAALREGRDRGVEAGAKVSAFDGGIDGLGSGVRVVVDSSPLLLLPVGFHRLSLAEIQRAIARGGEQVRARGLTHLPHVTACPEIGKEILDELLRQRRVPDVSSSEVAKRRVMRAKQLLESPLGTVLIARGHG